jgi:hypothetical protein
MDTSNGVLGNDWLLLVIAFVLVFAVGLGREVLRRRRRSGR